MKKLAVALICVFVMIFCLGGCGGSGTAAQGTEAKIEMPGTTESWGIYEEIFVPDGMKLTGGSLTDPEDQSSVWIQNGDNAMEYYLFVVSTEEQSKKDVAATKEYNKDSDPQDVTLTTGDYAWTGVAYKYGGETDVAQLYASIGGTVINVRMGGYAYDADSTKAILGSIKLKAEAEATGAEETAGTAETAKAEETAEATQGGESEATAETTAAASGTASDPVYGKSNADATGYVTLEKLQETYQWKNSAGSGMTYEDFRDHFGCDGAPWTEVFSDTRRGYKWSTEDGSEFLNVSFNIAEDGSEIYSSCTYSDAVRGN